MHEWPALVFVGRSYSWMRSGHLPIAGGWLAMPGILVDALELVEQVEVSLMEEQ